MKGEHATPSRETRHFRAVSSARARDDRGVPGGRSHDDPAVTVFRPPIRQLLIFFLLPVLTVAMLVAVAEMPIAIRGIAVVLDALGVALLVRGFGLRIEVGTTSDRRAGAKSQPRTWQSRLGGDSLGPCEVVAGRVSERGWGRLDGCCWWVWWL